MTRHRFLILLASLLTAFGSNQMTVSPAAQTVPFLDGEPNFLFLGNSYTRFSDLAMLTRTLLEEGVPGWASQTIRTDQRVPNGERFAGHLRQADGTDGNTTLRQWLVTSPVAWKWAVVQEQSQIPGFFDGPFAHEYEQSSQSSQALNQMIQSTGGQTLFFLTWGYRKGDSRNSALFPDYPTMQAALAEGYKRYVQQSSTDTRPTFLAPVGLVYECIYKDISYTGKDPTESESLFSQLYRPDGSHPTLLGSYLAALTIYSTLTGQDPTKVAWSPEGLDQDRVITVRDAVGRTVLKTFEDGTIRYPWLTPWPNQETIGMDEL